MQNTQNGKGSSPRNNWSKQFRDNYSEICWDKKCVLCSGTGFIDEPKIECPACKKKLTKSKINV